MCRLQARKHRTGMQGPDREGSPELLELLQVIDPPTL
jgi:hypothetical protein